MSMDTDARRDARRSEGWMDTRDGSLSMDISGCRRMKEQRLISTSWSCRGMKDPFHLIMCSEAGKPIYSYNKTMDDSALVSLAAVCQAISNFFADSSNGDQLKSINSLSGLKVTFCLKRPLILILVSHRLAPIDPQLILSQAFSQMVSILTLKQLRTMYQIRPTFDLRSILSRSDNKLIDILIEECLFKNASCYNRQVTFVGSESDRKNCSIHGYLTSVPHSSHSPCEGSQAPPTISGGHTSGGQILTNNRVLIPVLPLTPAMRESVTSMIETSVNSVKSEVLFALLFQRKVSSSTSRLGGAPSRSGGASSRSGGDASSEPDTSRSLNEGSFQEYDLNSTQLITIYNHSSKSAKLFPEDVQMIMTHVINSDSQLSSAESLWIPVCLPHLDSSAFIHSHISYLTNGDRTPSPVIIQTPEVRDTPVFGTEKGEETLRYTRTAHDEKLCFVMISVEKDDFHKCQEMKDRLCERLNKVRLTGWPLSQETLRDLTQLQMFSYYSHKPHAVIYRNLPYASVTNYHPFTALISSRMKDSGFKTLWFTSDSAHISILASCSSAGLFLFQFDNLITHADALIAASKINSWIKKEEDKIKLKDYQ